MQWIDGSRARRCPRWRMLSGERNECAQRNPGELALAGSAAAAKVQCLQARRRPQWRGL
jgi:hypothetical protein